MSRRQREIEADLERLAHDGFCADPLDQLQAAIGLLTPPERISITECAAHGRLLPTATGGARLWSPTMTPYINGIQDAIDDPMVRAVIVPGPARSGKALALDTPIATPSGWATMGRLNEGDEVFDDLGAVCRVVFATPVMVDHSCYRITFSDGAEIVADADHEWNVHYQAGKKGKVWTYGTRTTERMAARFLAGKRARPIYSIDVAGSLDLPEADLLIAPYTLGAWLGDGATIGNTLTIHENDQEIIQAIEADGYRADRRFRTATGVLSLGIMMVGDDRHLCPRGHDTNIVGRYDCGSCKVCAKQKRYERLYGTARDPIAKPAHFSTRLRALGVFGDKHIPVEYLRASKEQRLALLQGLMDTDGTIGTGNSAVTFTSTVKALADGVLELAISLGFKATIGRRDCYLYLNGERRRCADAYNVRFTAYSETPVFRLSRKRLRQRSRSAGRSTDTGRRRIVDIAPVASVPVRCIQVDSPSHLYLAGREMIPTHNTVAAENALFKRLKYGPMTDVLWYLPGAMFDNYTDTTFTPLFELHPDIAAKIGKGKSDNKRELKRIGGRFVMLLPANKRKIIGRQAPFIVGDEIDAYPKGLVDNFRQQVSIRARAYGNIGKAYLCSHPDAGWTGGIAAAWLESSRGVWWWPCPHCDQWSSPCPTAEVRTVLDYGRPEGMAGDDLLDHVEATARLLCPHCGAGIENEDKAGMLAVGRWVFDGEIINADGIVTGERRPNDTQGFWIHGTMSPFVSFGQLAREYVGALVFYENTKKPARLKEVTVKSLGEVFAGGDASAVDPARLKRRAKAVDEAAANGDTGHRLKTVPRWVLYLTAAVDVGGDKFDVLVQGWGHDGEGVIVDRFTLKAGPDGRSLAPGMRQADWLVVRDRVMKAVYPLAHNPARGLPIASTAVDTGGVPGVTWKAREFARQMKLGICAGTNAYRLRLIKGAASVRAQEIGNGREVNRDDQGKAMVPTVTEYDLGVHKLKELIAERFAIDTVGPGYLHLPVKFDPRYLDEMTNEALVDGKWERRGPNETFDLLVYNEAARQMLKPERPGIDWINRPPVWARSITLLSEVVKPAATVAGTPLPVPTAPKIDRRQALMERLAR